MQMIAHGKGKNHSIGPSPEVAKEFLDKTSKKRKKVLSRSK